MGCVSHGERAGQSTGAWGKPRDRPGRSGQSIAPRLAVQELRRRAGSFNACHLHVFLCSKWPHPACKAARELAFGGPGSYGSAAGSQGGRAQAHLLFAWLYRSRLQVYRGQWLPVFSGRERSLAQPIEWLHGFAVGVLPVPWPGPEQHHAERELRSGRAPAVCD